MFSAPNQVFTVPFLNLGKEKKNKTKQELPDLEARTNKQKNNINKLEGEKNNLKEIEIMQREENFKKGNIINI